MVVDYLSRNPQGHKKRDPWGTVFAKSQFPSFHWGEKSTNLDSLSYLEKISYIYNNSLYVIIWTLLRPTSRAAM